MNRATNILLELESVLSVSPDALALRFGVSPRTVAADIAHLNHGLGAAASIRLQDGRYRLLIVDARAYREHRDRLGNVRESFNDPRWREAHILARLLHSLVPLRTEDLAVDMRLGERPTLTPAGSFTNMTGLSGHGPKDTLTKHQLL